MQKPYFTDYNLLIAQDLWKAQYQLLLIILLKGFLKLNVNTGTIIKHVETKELNTKIVNVFLNANILETIK